MGRARKEAFKAFEWAGDTLCGFGSCPSVDWLMATYLHPKTLVVCFLLMGCQAITPERQCGLSSLAEIFRVSKKKVSYSDLQKDYGISKKVILFAELQAIGMRYDLSLEGFQLQHPRELAQFRTAIIELDNHHFVAMINSLRSGLLEICDTETGCSDWSTDYLASRWTGRVLAEKVDLRGWKGDSL